MVGQSEGTPCEGSWVKSHYSTEELRWSETAVGAVKSVGGGGGDSKNLVHFRLVPLLLDFQIFVFFLFFLYFFFSDYYHFIIILLVGCDVSLESWSLWLCLYDVMLLCRIQFYSCPFKFLIEFY